MKDGSSSFEVDHSLRQMLHRALVTDGKSVTSGLSDLSIGTGNRRKAAIDIWHPDFWNMDYEVANTPAEDASNNHGRGFVNAKERIVVIPECLQQKYRQTQLDPTEEESSVVSDISGLSDAFEEHHGHDEPKKQARVMRRGSVVGSIIGSCLKSDGSKVGTVVNTSSRSSILSKEKKKKVRSQNRVQFSEVFVRQYERILDDNPACRFGLSVGIGWRFAEASAQSVDEWEGSRRRKSTKSQLILSRNKRELLVRSLGYTDTDIAAAMREINKVKSNRRQTVNNLGLQQLEETVESAKRRVKRVLLPQLRAKA